VYLQSFVQIYQVKGSCPHKTASAGFAESFKICVQQGSNPIFLLLQTFANPMDTSTEK
jgi:hypothetical protein